MHETLTRLSPIICFVLLVGCAKQTQIDSAPPPPPPPLPPAVEAAPPPPPEIPPPPPPPPKRSSQTTSYGVPEDTRDPVLVERGVTEWLSANGYKDYQKVAMVRRIRQESGFNPCARGGPHHYLMQWRDGRLRDLYKHASVKPGTCPTWVAQLRYMDYEIKNNAHYGKFLNTASQKSAYAVFTVAYLGGRM